jgi:hypothetical protein
MTETTVKLSGGKRRRRFLIVALIAMLLLLLVRTGLDLWAGHRLKIEVVGLEKQYGSLDERTLNAAPVPEADNRARAIRAAAALTVLVPGGEYPHLISALNRFMTTPATAPLPTDLATFLEANRAALRVADEARTRRQSNWEAGYTMVGSSPPPWMEIKMLSNAIYLAARLDLHAGRPDDAAREIASGLAVSASVRQEPDLIAQLIRCALGIQQFEAVQQLVIQAEPSKVSLEELSRWLVENQGWDPAQVGLLSELKHFNAMLTRVENGNVARVTGAADSPFWLGPVAWLGRPLIRLAHVRQLKQVAHLLDEQTGPRPRPELLAPAAPPRLRWWQWMRRLDNVSVAGLERTMDTSDRFNSELGATELAVALRRFRIDHGTYPDALSALVPAYVANVPIDPFTGQPPVYSRDGAGFQLHAQGGKNVSPLTASALEWTVPK